MRRPALWTALLFVSGIWVSSFVHVPVLFWWIGTTGFLAAGSIALMRRRSEHLAGQVLFALMVFMAGAFRHAGVTRDSPGNHLSRFPDFGEPVALTGRVTDEPDVSRRKPGSHLRPGRWRGTVIGRRFAAAFWFPSGKGPTTSDLGTW